MMAVRAALDLMNASAVRLQVECQNTVLPDNSIDLAQLTQQVIQCAYDVAKAAKELVTTTAYWQSLNTLSYSYTDKIQSNNNTSVYFHRNMQWLDGAIFPQLSTRQTKTRTMMTAWSCAYQFQLRMLPVVHFAHARIRRIYELRAHNFSKGLAGSTQSKQWRMEFFCRCKRANTRRITVLNIPKLYLYFTLLYFTLFTLNCMFGARQSFFKKWCARNTSKVLWKDCCWSKNATSVTDDVSLIHCKCYN